MKEETAFFYDAIATDYDKMLEQGFITQVIRKDFQGLLMRCFQPGMHLLDMGCGTGTDAIFAAKHGMQVTGIDISAGMIAQAGEHCSVEQLDSLLTFRQSDIISALSTDKGLYDGAWSNFNTLNHIGELPLLVARLAAHLKPNSFVVLTLLNPVCLPEVMGYIARLQWLTAWRKLYSRKRTFSLPMQLYYPRQLAKIFSPHFNCREVAGYGLLVPPAQLYKGTRGKKLLRSLVAVERKLCRYFPFYNLCDQYIIIFEKK